MTVGDLIVKLSGFPHECPIVTDCMGSTHFQHASEPEAGHAIPSGDGLYSGCHQDEPGAIQVVYIPIIGF